MGQKLRGSTRTRTFSSNRHRHKHPSICFCIRDPLPSSSAPCSSTGSREFVGSNPTNGLESHYDSLSIPWIGFTLRLIFCLNVSTLTLFFCFPFDLLCLHFLLHLRLQLQGFLPDSSFVFHPRLSTVGGGDRDALAHEEPSRL